MFSILPITSRGASVFAPTSHTPPIFRGSPAKMPSSLSGEDCGNTGLRHLSQGFIKSINHSEPMVWEPSSRVWFELKIVIQIRLCNAVLVQHHIPGHYGEIIYFLADTVEFLD